MVKDIFATAILREFMSIQQPIPDDGRTIESRYQVAQTLLQGLRTQGLVQNDNVQPHWIEQTNCFWYQRNYKLKEDSHLHLGIEFRLVDAGKKTNSPTFDHKALAQSLAKEAKKNINAEDLPISDLKFSLSLSASPLSVSFTAFDQSWLFDCDNQTCVAIQMDDPEAVGINELRSPDGKQIAFRRDHNLWVRELASGLERALTVDGEEFFCYATNIGAAGVTFPGLNAQWSPDSKRLFTSRRDSRGVKTTPMVNHVPSNGQIRPTVEHIKVAYQGDKHVEQYHLICFDVASDKRCDADYPRLVAGTEDFGFFTGARRRAWWSNDSRHAYFIAHQGSGYQSLSVVELNTDSGDTRVLFKETSNTYVNIQPEYVVNPLHRYLPETNELIWWSERSGWGHLYLYDLNTGECKHQITRGDWLAREILQVDPVRRELVIQTAGRVNGRNPYYRDICRVNIDTGELCTLLSTDHEYCVPDGGIAPNNNYIITTRSKVDQVPISLLLNRQGETLMELETADISNLPDGWQWPESVKMTAAGTDTEGKACDIYGVLFRPTHFCENKKYPVINMIVSGPWLSAVPHGSFHNSRGYNDRYYFQGAALAELGFMVVVIDSRGTPLRSKAFQDSNYGWIPNAANTVDQRSGLEQLAARYPSMDLSRVGVYGPSGYPGCLQNLFEGHDFYSVGVVNILMDSRFLNHTSEHIDKYQGPDKPADDKRYPEQLVEHWDGKLLLIKPQSGMLSAAYAPAGMFRLVEAMQNANKDVDLLMRSNDKSGFLMTSYEQRRAWDYFVRNLQGVEPPKGFRLGEFNQ